MDRLRDETMAIVLGRPLEVEEHVRSHREWSEKQRKENLSEERSVRNAFRPVIHTHR